MKFALVDSIKSEASKGKIGKCIYCDSEVIAKCGDIKVNHWSHKAKRDCDPWWENETEWHRSWKNHFPCSWQEVVFNDERTGEKHIADICTNYNLIIEFQHSHIDHEERYSREQFYKNMIWLVDGTRLKRDYPRFLKGLDNFRKTIRSGFYLVSFPEECFPTSWIKSSVPVICDFKGLMEIDNPTDIRNKLCCLYPVNKESIAVVAMFSHKVFIDNIIKGHWFNKEREIITGNAKSNEKQRKTIKRRQSPYILERGKWKKRRRF